MLAIQRFSFVGAIDASFNLYRQHFTVLFLISLIVNVPTTFTNLLLGYAQHRLQTGALGENPWSSLADPSVVAELGPALGMFAGFFLLFLIVAMVAGMFGMAAATCVASGAALGRPVDLWTALGKARDVFWVLLGTSLLTSMAVFLGALFFIVPGIILALGFAFIGPVIVLEGTGVSDAIERSWFLTSGRRLKILGSFILIGLIITVATTGLVALLQVTPGMHGTLVGQVLQTLVSQAISALGTPVTYVVIVLLYYDGRVDHEAFDVETLARSAIAGPTGGS